MLAESTAVLCNSVANNTMTHKTLPNGPRPKILKLSTAFLETFLMPISWIGVPAASHRPSRNRRFNRRNCTLAQVARVFLDICRTHPVKHEKYQ